MVEYVVFLVLEEHLVKKDFEGVGNSVDSDFEGDFKDSGLQEDSGDFVDFWLVVALGDLLHLLLFLYIFNMISFVY